MNSDTKLRIDKFLWFARFFKTRSLAAEIVRTGHVRLNRQPVRKSSHSVAPGDILTFPQGPHIRVIEVLALATRRGPASEAQALYSDLSPPQASRREDGPTPVAQRDDGAGRPTKKQRRETDRLRAVWD